jgi:hypothetical protein
MNTKMVDVTIHIDEETSDAEKDALRNKLLEQNGVMAADYNSERSHLVIVEYNPDVVDSTELLRIVEKLKLHGELIGM